MPGEAETRFELSSELEPPHSSDVKAVLAIRDDLLVTASRDSSVAIWQTSQKAQVMPSPRL